LRIESARPSADLGSASKAGQGGAGFDFNAPALIVREMQVQDIQLVQSEQIDVLLYFADSEKMARDIEHGAAPGKTRLVDNRHRWNWPHAPGRAHLRFDLDRQ
jgi:hypothetical protein